MLDFKAGVHSVPPETLEADKPVYGIEKNHIIDMIVVKYEVIRSYV